MVLHGSDTLFLSETVRQAGLIHFNHLVQQFGTISQATINKTSAPACHMDSEITTVILILSLTMFTLNGIKIVLQKFWLSVPLAAVFVGISIGPHGLNVLPWNNDSSFYNQVILQVSKYTLAVTLMEMGLRINVKMLKRRKKFVILALGPGMIIMWLTSAAILYFFAGIPIWNALLIGAVATPTDPVVSSTIVTGDVAQRNIPATARENITIESGANDGLAYPFVMLPILALTTANLQQALSEWVLRTLLWQVGAASVAGLFIGYVAGKALLALQKANWLHPLASERYALALSFLVVSATGLLGMDGILSVFLSALAFSHVVGSEHQSTARTVQQVASEFLLVPFFVLLGAALPFHQWLSLGLAGAAVALAVLLGRRIADIAILSPFLPRSPSWHVLPFYGWFAPVAVAAAFYAALTSTRISIPELWSWVTLIISISLVIHGITATPFAKILHRALGPERRRQAAT